jgi:hypothetical protein
MSAEETPFRFILAKIRISSACHARASQGPVKG